MRLLLVEDQPDAARLIAKGLREQSYAVDVAADGVAAAHQAANHEYDAIVLDVMPSRLRQVNGRGGDRGRRLGLRR